MNVIFLDFDGVINTYHDQYITDKEYSQVIENRIKILSKICNECNCKVVIESSIKDDINEETLKTDIDWVNDIFVLFKKYNIECIGRTPTIKKELNNGVYLPIWKEDEIRLYLFNHPEIEHYVIIDDDDRQDMHMVSDLDKVRNHLVKTEFFSTAKEQEGLLEKHIDEVIEILKKENEIRNLLIKNKKILDYEEDNKKNYNI